jgi:ribonuclease BN (tRNA processing enzyme)
VAIVIDCGPGVFSRLQQHIAPEAVRAVVISHMHADHTLDLLQYRYYLFFRALAGQHDTPPTLYLPPGGHSHLLRISGTQDSSPAFYADHFVVREYEPHARLQEGPFSITVIPVLHVPHTYGMRVQGRASFAFSADSGPCAGLAQVAHESDLFLCECANDEQSTYPFHLTPRQAGAVARAAGAQRLLLTHRWWLQGEESAVAGAREQFSGPIELAREGMQVAIAPCTAGVTG